MSNYRKITLTVTIEIHDSVPFKDAVASAQAIRKDITKLAKGDVVVITASSLKGV